MVDSGVAGQTCLAVVLASAAVFAFAAIGVARGWWRHEVSFGLIGLSALGSAFALFTLVRSWLRTAPAVASLDVAAGAVASLLGLAVVLLPLLFLLKVATSPWIHDITTDLENPPRFVAAAALRSRWSHPVDYEGEKVAAIQREKYPEVAPRTLPSPPAAAFEHALAAARRRGWEIVSIREGEGVFEAIESTPLLGFKDDVVVRVTGVESGSRVDVRSASRVGDTDLGVNAKRVRAYLDSL